MAKIIFITGTGTGVGKTILTTLLTLHLRRAGVHAFAMKPFCSGGLEDVHLLKSAQESELSDREINPFYFAKPLAPLAAAPASKLPSLKDVLRKIEKIRERCDVLLVEGSGGLLVPLGQRYFVADLVSAIDCDVLLVAPNQLGTINHTLLSVQELSARNRGDRFRIALMDQLRPDLSAATNAKILQSFVSPNTVIKIPYLGRNADRISALREAAVKLRKTLSQLIQS